MQPLLFLILTPLAACILFTILDLSFNQGENHFVKTPILNLIFCYLSTYTSGFAGIFISHPSFPHFMRKYSFSIITVLALPLLYFLLIKLESYLGITSNAPLVLRSIKTLTVIVAFKIVYDVLLSQFG